MISKDKFTKLSFKEKSFYLFADGEYIITREYYNHKINLYTLYCYPVEVWYFPATNSIEKIEVVEEYKILKLYFDRIDI